MKIGDGSTIQTSEQLRNGSPSRRHSSIYDIVKFDGEAVWIIDRSSERPLNEVWLSVTNDAGHVATELALHYGGRRIYYRDTNGRWDELAHDCGKFVGFKPNAPTP